MTNRKLVWSFLLGALSFCLIIILIAIIVSPNQEVKGKKDKLVQLEDRDLFFKVFDAAFDVGMDELRKIVKEQNLEYLIIGFRWARTENKRGNQIYIQTIAINREYWNRFSKEQKLFIVEQFYRAIKPLFEKVDEMAKEKGYPYEGSILIISDGKTPLATVSSKTPAVLYD